MRRRRRDKPGARAAACAILDSVEGGCAHSNALLAALPESMERRERALTTELVYGVLRRRRALDRAIVRASDRRLNRIDQSVLIALRVGVHQILHLNRIPPSAAVNEMVKLVRARSGPGASAFANALLRAVCRLHSSGALADPVSPGAEAEPRRFGDYLEEAYSFPRFLVDRFVNRYGPSEAEALLATMNRPAPVVLRPRRISSAADLARRLAEQGVVTIPSPIVEGALRVVKGIPQRTPLFQGGEVYIQDEASQLVTRLLEPVVRGDSVIDLCAAPGGKILGVVDGCAPGAGPFVAADNSRLRLRALEENVRRLGIQGVLSLVMDATQPAVRGRFTRVLLDAPCSGTGIIRRRPEIRWRRTARQIERYAAIQARALRQASELVAPGGRLVYAVCSLEPEEGKERVMALMEESAEMELLDARLLLPASAHHLVDPSGFLMTLPHRDDVDGFLAAALARRGRAK